MKLVTLFICLALSSCNLSDSTPPTGSQKKDMGKDPSEKGMDFSNSDMQKKDQSSDAPSADLASDLGRDLGSDVGGDTNVDTPCTNNGCPMGELCTDSRCLKTCRSSQPCQNGFSCQQGVCVAACSTDAECAPAICDMRDASKGTCAPGVRPHSKGQCETCISDSECKIDSRCIPLNDGANFHGNYCLKISKGMCARPFKTLVTKPSLNGLPTASYCGINETISTCEAVLSFGTNCDNGMGKADPTRCDKDQGFCILHNAQFWACSYACTSKKSCHDASSCVNAFCEIIP